MDLINAAELAEFGIFEDVADEPDPDFEPAESRFLWTHYSLPVGPDAADRAWLEAYTLFRDGETPEDIDGRAASDAEFHAWHSGRRRGMADRKRAIEREAARIEAELEMAFGL